MTENINMKLYSKYREVPKDAQKTIEGGNINGFTSINPMWRIQALTEEFGPCGCPVEMTKENNGWFPEIVKYHPEPSMASDEVIASMEIKLYYNDGTGWRWVPGIGSSRSVKTQKSGNKVNDECYKMAFTDAMSVACKLLGFGANIHWADGSKYDELPTPEPKAPAELPTTKISEARAISLAEYCDKHHIDIPKYLPSGVVEIAALTNEEAEVFRASLKSLKGAKK